VTASRTRFSTRGPKKRRGTTVRFRLGAPAKVFLTVHGPSPSCGIVGTKVVRGRSGMNTVRLSGRFNGRPLSPGTYSVVVVAQRGGKRTRVGRISIQVVPPGRSLLREPGSPPEFRCVSSTGSGTAGPGLSGTVPPPPGKAQLRPPDLKQPAKGGVLAIPPLHLGGGSGTSFSDGLLALILYASLGFAGSVLLVCAVRYLRGTWSP
jgi:hypothetical protein